MGNVPPALTDSTSQVQSMLFVCFYLYQQRQKCEFACSTSCLQTVTHHTWPVTAYLSNCCRWCQQRPSLQNTTEHFGHFVTRQDLSWHVWNVEWVTKKYPYEWIQSLNMCLTRALCHGKMQSAECFILRQKHKEALQKGWKKMKIGHDSQSSHS